MDKKLSENMPIYVQIMNSVKGAIAAGELAPSQRVPSVRDLARDFEVNPNTMQRALNELEREGLLIAERTSGRFVTSDKELINKLKTEMAVITADNFRKEMAALGFSDDEMIDFFRERCRKEIAATAAAPERAG
ncbi:MAG: GntR family transcriptional regulator [Firmicutes bacterium]|nr:GntR family transcriptional regulator [Bacillota bacterium]